MLSATHRLRRSKDFAATIRGGRRAGRGTVVVHLTVPGLTEMDQRPGDGSVHPPRAGFVVSKAVGNAVVRNRVRRRLRHLASPRLVALPPGAVLVVRALPPAAGATYGALGADLDAAVAAAREPRGPRSTRRR